MKKEQEIKIYTDYITLGSFLKFIGVVGQGSDVKFYLSSNNILVNNELYLDTCRVGHGIK